MMEDAANIKEIEISSYFPSKKDGFYKDVFHLASDALSYKAISVENGKEVANWSYRSSSDEFSKRINDAYEGLAIDLHGKASPYLGDTELSFCVVIIYKDGKQEKIERKGTFAANHLSYFASAVLKIIPKDEPYSGLMNAFRNRKASLENLSQIRKRHIIAFLYNDDYAIEEKGSFDLLTDDFTRYYGKGDNEGDGVGWKEAIKLLEGADIENYFDTPFFQSLIINGELWFYMNPSEGCHLYLEHEYFFIIAKMLSFDQPWKFQERWDKLFRVDFIENE